MYISINYYLNNIYLYHKNPGPILCKNNFAYKIDAGETYNKIICLISNTSTRDSISLVDNKKIKLNINPIWGLANISQAIKLVDRPIKKNILIPNLQDISLIDEKVDLNAINCLCHDNTHIFNIPSIKIDIQNNSYLLKDWTGNNQVWCSMIENGAFFIYAYLYIFYDKSILLISQTPKDPDINHYFDLDLMSIYYHNSIVQDEYGRINCSEYKPRFSDIKVLNTPTDKDITSNISIDTDELLPN